MEDEKKAAEPCVGDEKKKKLPWDTSGCPFFFFGDKDAAEYDIDKFKAFLKRFKKTK